MEEQLPGIYKAGKNELPFAEVLDNIDVGIVVYDRNGNFVFVNRVMINWRNIPRNEYLTMNVRDFYGFIDVCVYDLVRQKKQTVSRLQYYQDCQKPNAPTRMRIVTGTPIFDGSGNIEYVITKLQDVESFQTLYKTLRKQTNILRESVSKTDQPVKPNQDSIVAESQELKQVFAIADSVAPLDSSVLIYGESGSGKEVFARYIHEHSDRRDKPMITVNCAAFSESLIESELFGYEKGSFTGANKEGKVGLIQAADGGTLFLDEINSLPMSMQGKILRVIEEKSVQRVGAIRTKKVDFRLIAATNQNLHQLVEKGDFRRDLYYRLNVLPLIIPPVRQRRDDIVPLCLYFLEYFCKKYNLKKTFSQSVLRQVRAYSWPGNVREIRNFVERVVVMTPYATTEINSIPEGLLYDEERGEKPEEHHTPKTAEREGPLDKETVAEALRLFEGNRTKAAEYLGISRRYLQYKVKEYDLPARYVHKK